MNRRDFVSSSSAALAVAGIGLPAVPQRIDRIGIQLYTVRKLFMAEPEKTLAALRKIGYKEVEFAGYPTKSALETRAMLKKAGLAAPSAHIDLGAIRERWQATLDFAREVGHRYLIVAWLDEADRKTLKDYRRVADLLTKAADEAAKSEIEVGYHNHDFEFDAPEGYKPYDVLLRNTSSSVVFEMDLYWITKAGGGPLDFFTRFTGRFPLVHVKDMGKDRSMVDVGSGTIDFKRIFAQRKLAGIKHYFVEHDDPADPLGFAKRSYDYLDQLTF